MAQCHRRSEHNRSCPKFGRMGGRHSTFEDFEKMLDEIFAGQENFVKVQLNEPSVLAVKINDLMVSLLCLVPDFYFLTKGNKCYLPIQLDTTIRPPALSDPRD